MILLMLLLPINLCAAFVKTTHSDDICGNFDGRRIYLELGDHGVLTAKKLNLDDNEVSHWYKRNHTSHQRCGMELITCSSCIITVKFTFLNISRNCGKNTMMDSCGCDYVWLYEPYFEDVSGEQFCGHFVDNNSTSLIYKSHTRIIAIAFLYSQSHTHAFTLEYTSEHNRRFFTGRPTYGNKNNLSQIISSPFFPYMYPKDLSIEYIIKCQTNEKCYISLIFTDFQIAPSSLIELFDWNGQRIHVTTGSLFRPPALMSSGSKLTVRFYANGDSSMGFKAMYSFSNSNKTSRPNTDCGGHVDNLGGAITMMNMVEEGTEAYDCFWIIRPPDSYLYLKSHIYLKIQDFSDFAGATELTVRRGLTSNAPIVETLRHPVSQFLLSKQKEHVVPISEGLYVSLRGLFRAESKLTIVYAAFSYKECYSVSDFLCSNHRCISTLLNCDGFDHCGDNSDEPPSCVGDPKERFWSHKPNYFFPKVDQYSDLKTATIVFVACSLGLISLIFALIILLYRINTQAHNRRRMQDHLQTINDLLGETLQGNEEIIFPDDPPIYEAPPDYEQVVDTFVKEKIQNGLSELRPCSRCAAAAVAMTSSSQDVSLELEANTIRVIPDSPPPAYSSSEQNINRENTRQLNLDDENNHGNDGKKLSRQISISEPSSPIYANVNNNTTRRNFEESGAASFNLNILTPDKKLKGFNDFKQEVINAVGCINKSRLFGDFKSRRERRFSDGELTVSENIYYTNTAQNFAAAVLNTRRSVSFENISISAFSKTVNKLTD